jgi:uncharacterized protein with von Willebrand factor type A (vWA) domain
MARKSSSDKLLLNLIAEIQAIAVALKRVGEKMAAAGSSDAVHAAVLLEFFQKNSVANALDSIYVKAIEQVESNDEFAEKDLDSIDALCGKKLKQRYGIDF